MARKAEPVTTIKVRPDVWQAALRAAEGDPKRITIVSERKVIITERRQT